MYSKNGQKQQVIGLISGLFMLTAVTSCTSASAGVLLDPQQPTPSITLSTETPIPNASLTITALPSETATALPPTPTSSPRPSIAPRTQEPSPTPLPQPLIIGYSVTERPLEVYHFGDGPSKRLIVAGIHGGYEWNTIALADQLIEYLIEDSSMIPAEITLYILRSANPDGAARVKGSAGRANENGVDINRNFPANWAAEWNRRGCWNHLPITAGTRPMSEPETGAIMKFMLSNQIEALISYHSAALGIFAGGQPPDADSVDLAQTLAAVAPYTYPPPYDTGCEYTGQLTDWASAHNIAAVDIELTNHENTDFYSNLNILEAFLAWEGSK
jgi:hypothetical protein